MMGDDQGHKSQKAGGVRAERLEAELRANLKKRKAQARARAQAREETPAPRTTKKDEA